MRVEPTGGLSGAGREVWQCVRAMLKSVREAVSDNVRRQVEAGIDVANDGEAGKPSFFTYLLDRVSGFEVRAASADAPRVGPIDPNGRDAQQFPD